MEGGAVGHKYRKDIQYGFFCEIFFSQFIPFRNIMRKEITSKSVAQKFELK
jgi:hypothetical protein